MKNLLSAALLILSFHMSDGHTHGGSSVSGEWLPIVQQTQLTNVVAQIQSSPLGNEILLEYSGSDVLEVLAKDGKAFLRISPHGVEGNLDHAAWYRSQVAGERPLPEAASDGIDEPSWHIVSNKPYWGWYDKRLEKQDEHQDQWQILLKENGRASAIKGHFKSLVPPSHKTLVTLDRKRLATISGLSAILINGPEPAIRLSYKGEDVLTVLDESDQPMLKFSQQGVEARIVSAGWQQLGRLPLKSDKEWVKISHQAAYTWPDTRLNYLDEATQWEIPFKRNNYDLKQSLLGSWLRVKSAVEGQYSSIK